MPAPYRHGRVFWIRIARSDHRQVKVSTGTTNKTTAKAIARMVDDLVDRGERAILDAVATRRLDIMDVWSKYRVDSRLETTKLALHDVDLEPLVSDWARYLCKRGTGSAARYVAQVRGLIPSGLPFPRSAFRRARISEYLAGLSVSPSTSNRHRSALLQFARWLVEREVLEYNPVRDVRASKENPARSVIYTPAEVMKLVNTLSGDHRVLGAVLASTGMEMQAALRLRRRDVNIERRELHAHGGKNPWRNRTCAVTEPWAWPIIEAHVRTMMPDALLFSIRHDQAIDAHHRACKAAKLPPSTLHDHRHHYAVMLRRRGVADTVIARQLGHRDTVLVARVYGAYQPEIAEVTRAAGGVYAKGL